MRLRKTARRGELGDRHDLYELSAKILEVAKQRGALRHGKYVLSSGKTSNYYFDGRTLTLDPEGANLVARAVFEVAKEAGAEVVAGPTVGADPIVAATAAISYEQGRPISGLIVRKEAKRHGGERIVEGPLPASAKVMVVDDTCTSGASLLHAISVVEKAGCEVIKVLCVLDRREGGSNKIKRLGYDFEAILEADKNGKIKVVCD